MRNVRRWKKLCAPVLAAACFAGTVGQNFTGSCSFVQAAETESETEAETVYSQEDLELLNSLDQAEAEGVDGLDADSIDWERQRFRLWKMRRSPTFFSSVRTAGREKTASVPIPSLFAVSTRIKEKSS